MSMVMIYRYSEVKGFIQWVDKGAVAEYNNFHMAAMLPEYRPA